MIVPWVTLFRNCSWNFDPLKNMAAMGRRLFALYGHQEILKKSSLKPLVRFWNNFTGMFLGWAFSNFVCKILFCWKTWPPWGGGDFLHYMNIKEILKKSSPLKLLVRIWNNYTGMILGWALLKFVRKFWSVEKHGRRGGGGRLFALYEHKEILKKSSSKPQVRIWNKIVPCANFSKIVREHLIHWKIWPPWLGGRLFSLCGLQRKSSEFFSS